MEEIIGFSIILKIKDLILFYLFSGKKLILYFDIIKYDKV